MCVPTYQIKMMYILVYLLKSPCVHRPVYTPSLIDEIVQIKFNRISVPIYTECYMNTFLIYARPFSLITPTPDADQYYAKFLRVIKAIK